MPDEKPRLAARGFFEKPDYVLIYKNWKNMGGIYAFSDYLEIRRGAFNFSKTDETIYLKEIVSFSLHMNNVFGLDFNPWMEINYRKGGALKKIEFYGGLGFPSGAAMMLADWLGRRGVIRCGEPPAKAGGMPTLMDSAAEHQSLKRPAWPHLMSEKI